MKFTLFALAALALSVDSVLANGHSHGEFEVDPHYDEGDAVYPSGVAPPKGHRPTSPPPKGHSNVYHPSHKRVDIDDCDDDENDDWHYVHTGTPVYPDQPSHTWSVSTVTEACTSTIVDCDEDDSHCPGESTHYTTVEHTTSTLCPVPSTTETQPCETPTETETHWYPTETPSHTQPVYSVSTPCPESSTNSSTWTTWTYVQPPAPTSETPCQGADCPHYYPPPPPPPPKETVPTAIVPGVPQGPSGTVSIVYPPSTPTAPIVTAGAAQTVQRVSAALVAGLFFALA